MGENIGELIEDVKRTTDQAVMDFLKHLWEEEGSETELTSDTVEGIISEMEFYSGYDVFMAPTDTNSEDFDVTIHCFIVQGTKVKHGGKISMELQEDGLAVQTAVLKDEALDELNESWEGVQK
ncbi:MAG TPA: hypothetical protein VLA13_06240 [Massilibacterium sp.]|nr:hypothetical protein [Massilibacterium sp.]